MERTFTTLNGTELRTPVTVVDPKTSDTPTARTITHTGTRTNDDQQKATTKSVLAGIVMSEHLFDKTMIRNKLHVVGCSHCSLTLSLEQVLELFRQLSN